MSSQPSREPVSESVSEDETLLVEAVSVLVRRQRETEAWVTAQLCRAEERAAASEQRSVELEARLQGIEDRLARLIPQVEPRRVEAASNESLARLRQDLEDLKAQTDGRPARDASPPTSAAGVPSFEPLLPPRAAPSNGLQPARATTGPDGPPVPQVEGPGPQLDGPPAPQVGALAAAAVRPVPVAHAAAGVGRSTIWDVIGASPEERFGLVLIGAGAVAVLYAILTQLHPV